MLYVFCHNLRACGAVHVVNLLKLNHMFYFSLQKLKIPGLRIPYYILSVQHPEQCPALARGM